MRLSAIHPWFLLWICCAAIRAEEGASNRPFGDNESRIVHRPVGRQDKPRLEIDPAHPFYLRYGTNHLLLVGASDRDALTIWRNPKGFDWMHYLDALQANGFNYVRQNATAWSELSSQNKYPAQFPEPRRAFLRTGPGNAVDGLARFDLARFDAGYFQERLVPFLEESERRGIIVELTLFDACRSRRAFLDSLYAEANNVNHLGLQPGDDPHGDAALANDPLRRIQEQYVARIVDETKTFGNIIYEVANETGGAGWVSHFVAYLHRLRPGCVVSAGEQGSRYDPVHGDCDLLVKHRGSGGAYFSDQDVARHRQSLIKFRQGRKPVLHNEFFLFVNRSTGDPNFVRKMFWADVTGGGHANFYDFSWWRGTGRTRNEGTPSRTPPVEVLHAARYLRKFFEEGQVPYQTMEPCDGAGEGQGKDVVDPFIFGWPGRVYVVYLLQGGRFALMLPGAERAWTGRWYNPRTGSWHGFLTRKPGRQSFQAPDPQDWVLHLRAD